MAMMNSFDLLGEFESDDPNQIVASRPLKVAAAAEKKAPATAPTAAKQAKLPSKPMAPAQDVKEAKNDNARGGGRGGGRGFGGGRNGGGYNRDSASNGNTYSNNNGFSDRVPAEDGESGKPLERRNYGSMQGGFRGGRHGGSNNGEAAEVKEAKNDNARGGGRGDGRGFGVGRNGGGYNRDSASNGNTYSNNNGFSDRYKPAEDGESGKPLERRNYGSMQGGFRGGRHGGSNNGEAAEGERHRRPYERRSGTGRGNEIKRDGAGKRNWGTASDDIAPVTEEPTAENENGVEAEKQVVDEVTGDANKDSTVVETEEKEPEDKEMTLEEYEKVLEEKRKALLALKAKERKVVVDKEFEKMQLLSSKKSDEEIFVKLGSDKDKRKEAAEKEEKAKKQPVSINEFLKPAESGGAGGRRGGRGRGGAREGFSGRNMMNNVAAAPSINDAGQFPSLCAK